jgi:class 3 adenylate cyclase
MSSDELNSLIDKINTIKKRLEEDINSRMIKEIKPITGRDSEDIKPSKEKLLREVEELYNIAIEQVKINKEFNEYFLYKIKKLEDFKKLEKTQQDMVVIFLDMANSTKIMEENKALRVINIVEYLLDEMDDLVVENKGAFIKSLGDGALIAFSSKYMEETYNFLKMIPSIAKLISEEINQRVKAMNKRYLTSYPEIEIVVTAGVSYGKVLFGTFGEAVKHIDIYGRKVNLASRIQTLNNKLNTVILAEEDYIKALIKKDKKFKKVPFRKKVFNVELKGIKKANVVYEIPTYSKLELGYKSHSQAVELLEALDKNNIPVIKSLAYVNYDITNARKIKDIGMEKAKELIATCVRFFGPKDSFAKDLYEKYKELEKRLS